jgi:hypothetical protein
VPVSRWIDRRSRVTPVAGEPVGGSFVRLDWTWALEAQTELGRDAHVGKIVLEVR